MSTLYNALRVLFMSLFGWLPTPIYVVLVQLFAIFLIVLIIKLLALILSAIPFL